MILLNFERFLNFLQRWSTFGTSTENKKRQHRRLEIDAETISQNIGEIRFETRNRYVKIFEKVSSFLLEKKWAEIKIRFLFEKRWKRFGSLLICERWLAIRTKNTKKIIPTTEKRSNRCIKIVYESIFDLEKKSWWISISKPKEDGICGNRHKSIQKYVFSHRNLKRKPFVAKCEPIWTKFWEKLKIILEIVNRLYFWNLPTI